MDVHPFPAMPPGQPLEDVFDDRRPETGLSSYSLRSCVTVHPGWPCRRPARRRGAPSEVVTLTTKDGVQLRATYFPGARSKGQPPGEANDARCVAARLQEHAGGLTPLALRLQTPGESGADHPYFAAIIVDLRAHGESTKHYSPDGTAAESGCRQALEGRPACDGELRHGSGPRFPRR